MNAAGATASGQVFVEPVLVVRQVIAFGNVSDALSGAAIRGFTAQFAYQDDRRSGILPVDLNVGAGGWFVAHLRSTSIPAGFPHGSRMQLGAEFDAAGYQPARVQVQVPAAHFTLVPFTLPRHPGSSLLRLAGPPTELSARLLPVPVGLRGIVIHDHDPASPVSGASIDVPGLPQAIADADGRFTLLALPVTAQVDVRVSDGTHQQTHHLTVDYGQPLNVATLSLSRSNVENDHG